MKKIILFITLLISIFSFAQKIEINSSTAVANFNYYSKSAKGTLGNVKAEINLNLSDLSKSIISGSADVSKLNTNNKTRDEHLMAEDYFDVKSYPKMKFRSSLIYKKEGSYFVKGNLTIKDIKKEVIFRMNIKEDSMTLSLDIYALDFGVAIKNDRDHSRVGVNLVFKI